MSLSPPKMVWFCSLELKQRFLYKGRLYERTSEDHANQIKPPGNEAVFRYNAEVDIEVPKEKTT